MHTHLASPMRGPVTKTCNSWVDALIQENLVDVPSIGDPEIRTELVKRVRREIAEGTYDTPEKFDQALDRLLDRLESE